MDKPIRLNISFRPGFDGKVHVTSDSSYEGFYCFPLDKGGYTNIAASEFDVQAPCTLHVRFGYNNYQAFIIAEEDDGMHVRVPVEREDIHLDMTVFTREETLPMLTELH